MKVELREIVEQVTDAIRSTDYGHRLNDNDKVSACICAEDNKITGWVIVDVAEDGTLTSKTRVFKDLSDLFENWYK